MIKLRPMGIAFAMLASSVLCPGAVGPGDKPVLEFKSIEGQPVSLKALRGKLVVVDFWTVSDAGKNMERRLVEVFKEQAKAAFDQVQKEKDAADALTVARRLRDQKQDEQAYGKLKGIVQDYPNTRAAADAGPIIADYEKDPAFMQRMQTQVVDAQAKSLLNMARNYANARRSDLAKEKYQEVIDQFPNTRHAETARQELARLEKP